MRLALLLLLLSTPALAGPRVVADIAPVHALAARVMAGVGAPELLLPAEMSPHDAQLRPSDARRLDEADVVFWIGHGLAPWLERPLEGLAASARVVELLDTDGLTLLETREHDGFDGHHGHGDDVDPHIWLDPTNAATILAAMAEVLAEVDPTSAALYRENAAAGAAELTALRAEIAETLAPFDGRRFILLHDGFQYFEARFGLRAAGSVLAGDGAAASARRIARIQALADAEDVVCVFTEPQLPARLADVVAAETDLNRAVLDPLGRGLAPGAELYPALLRRMAGAVAACLG